jgi:hypothetical protein
VKESWIKLMPFLDGGVDVGTAGVGSWMEGSRFTFFRIFNFNIAHKMMEN